MGDLDAFRGAFEIAQILLGLELRLAAGVAFERDEESSFRRIDLRVFRRVVWFDASVERAASGEDEKSCFR